MGFLAAAVEFRSKQFLFGGSSSVVCGLVQVQANCWHAEERFDSSCLEVSPPCFFFFFFWL